MSLWKAQAVWDVKDFNLWRGVSVTEPQKTPQEAWRSLCCFRCDMSWGIWYLSVVMPHTAHVKLQAKKNRILMEMQENPRTSQQHAQIFYVSGVYVSQSSCSFLRDTAQIYLLSQCLLSNIHEVILEFIVLLCSGGWLCSYRCIIDQQITGKARGLDEYSEAASALTEPDLELQCREGWMYVVNKQCWASFLQTTVKVQFWLVLIKCS